MKSSTRCAVSSSASKPDALRRRRQRAAREQRMAGLRDNRCRDAGSELRRSGAPIRPMSAGPRMGGVSLGREALEARALELQQQSQGLVFTKAIPVYPGAGFRIPGLAPGSRGWRSARKWIRRGDRSRRRHRRALYGHYQVAVQAAHIRVDHARRRDDIGDAARRIPIPVPVLSQVLQ
jgi:hypothetical protein